MNPKEIHPELRNRLPHKEYGELEVNFKNGEKFIYSPMIHLSDQHTEAKPAPRTYKQCRFKKGDSETVAFIPAWAAVVGNKVQLITLDGDLWTVTEASEKVFGDEYEHNAPAVQMTSEEFNAAVRSGEIQMYW